MGEKYSFLSLYERLKFAGVSDYTVRFEEYLSSARALSSLIAFDTRYLYTEVLLTSARIVQEAGGEVQSVLENTWLHRDAAFFADEARVLSECRSILGRAVSYRDRGGQIRRNYAVNKACLYLDTHYTDPSLSFQDVVNHVSLSPSHFSTLFAQSVGVTFTRYLINLRLRKAGELLRNTDLRSSEIAYAVGFNDPHYFSHLFKKSTGQTPGEYRDALKVGKKK